MVGPASVLFFGIPKFSSRNHWLLIMRLLCAILVVTLLSPPAAAALPNIVLIVADDLGYGEVGIHHQGDIGKVEHGGGSIAWRRPWPNPRLSRSWAFGRPPDWQVPTPPALL